MRLPQNSWLPILLLYSVSVSVSVLFGIDKVLVVCDGRCLEDQRSVLLQLKQSLIFSEWPCSDDSKLASWNSSTDCCSSWKGVTCDIGSGHVSALDLSSECISGGIDNISTTLFDLRYHLQSLNLANNYFNSMPIPSGLDKLVNLTTLNLSNAGFGGQVPIEISGLTRLVSLDLSTIPMYGQNPLILEKPDLRTLVRDLSGLRILRLDGINLSAKGNQWCRALSSALPNLRVLSLSNCLLSGPLDSSLSKLGLLSQIDLSLNDLSAEVPLFFENFINLTSLHLTDCGLYGRFPDKILQLTTLQSLDVSENPLLYGFLPEFPPNRSLIQSLVLSGCSFNGSIPSSIIALNRLECLDLSKNSFTGPIPQLPETVTQVNLSHNMLTGPLSDSHWKRLVKLEVLDLGDNSLNGEIPWSLFTLPSLAELQLSQNQFVGQLTEVHNRSSSAPLDTLDLNSNNLEGPIPLSIFEFTGLQFLSLSSNNFSGTIELEMIDQKLQNLIGLDLSYNNLLLINTTIRNPNSSFPQLWTLKLVSCKLQGFPDFLRHNQQILAHLDLSNNQIHGEIPTWVWNISNGFLDYLNLSFNFLNKLEFPDQFTSVPVVLDLHSNILQGPIPVLLPSLRIGYVDFSNNSFQSIIPSNIEVFNKYYSLSSNNLTGEIPQSMCNAPWLEVLDLSNNSLSGTIPSCFANMSTLAVLNLRGNHFVGRIPQEFHGGCSLKTLDLSVNKLEGPLPTALANCKKLEVLDLAYNQINGAFPFWLASFPDLRVLILRSNGFTGPISGYGISNHTFLKLQIIDLSSNNFTGDIPPEFFMKETAMMADENKTQSKIKHEALSSLDVQCAADYWGTETYYQDTVTIIIKGQEMELTKILTIHTSIDLSKNGFQGEIPDVLGNLTYLYLLNLSHNALTGGIPSSLGNLKQLESLDLSSNKLRGEIPQQLASLTFLSVLNLSWNNLTGMIPKGTQFQTFSDTSFKGNAGLCGAPLSRSCTNNTPPTLALAPMLATSNKKRRQLFGYDWQIVLSGFLTGYGGGVGLVVAFFLFSDRGRRWLLAPRK